GYAGLLELPRPELPRTRRRYPRPRGGGAPAPIPPARVPRPVRGTGLDRTAPLGPVGFHGAQQDGRSGKGYRRPVVVASRSCQGIQTSRIQAAGPRTALPGGVQLLTLAVAQPSKVRFTSTN